MKKPFSSNILDIDPENEVEKITAALRNLLKNPLKRRGLVVGISGGIDSSVTAALAVKAIGAQGLCLADARAPFVGRDPWVKRPSC